MIGSCETSCRRGEPIKRLALTRCEQRLVYLSCDRTQEASVVRPQEHGAPGGHPVAPRVHDGVTERINGVVGFVDLGAMREHSPRMINPAGDLVSTSGVRFVRLGRLACTSVGLLRRLLPGTDARAGARLSDLSTNVG